MYIGGISALQKSCNYKIIAHQICYDSGCVTAAAPRIMLDIKRNYGEKWQAEIRIKIGGDLYRYHVYDEYMASYIGMHMLARQKQFMHPDFTDIANKQITWRDALSATVNYWDKRKAEMTARKKHMPMLFIKSKEHTR